MSYFFFSFYVLYIWFYINFYLFIKSTLKRHIFKFFYVKRFFFLLFLFFYVFLCDISDFDLFGTLKSSDNYFIVVCYCILYFNIYNNYNIGKSFWFKNISWTIFLINLKKFNIYIYIVLFSYCSFLLYYILKLYAVKSKTTVR